MFTRTGWRNCILLDQFAMKWLDMTLCWRHITINILLITTITRSGNMTRKSLIYHKVRIIPSEYHVMLMLLHHCFGVALLNFWNFYLHRNCSIIAPLVSGLEERDCCCFMLEYDADYFLNFNRLFFFLSTSEPQSLWLRLQSLWTLNSVFTRCSIRLRRLFALSNSYTNSRSALVSSSPLRPWDPPQNILPFILTSSSRPRLLERFGCGTRRRGWTFYESHWGVYITPRCRRSGGRKISSIQENTWKKVRRPEGTFEKKTYLPT